MDDDKSSLPVNATCSRPIPCSNAPADLQFVDWEEVVHVDVQQEEVQPSMSYLQCWTFSFDKKMR
jgi:hypothetical protein